MALESLQDKPVEDANLSAGSTSLEPKSLAESLREELEKLKKDLTDVKVQSAKREERLLAELDTTKKLAELYKEKADEAATKSTNLMSLMKTFESHLQQQEDQHKEKLKREAEAKAIAEQELRLLKLKIDGDVKETEEEEKEENESKKSGDSTPGSVGSRSRNNSGNLSKIEPSSKTKEKESRDHLFPPECITEEFDQYTSKQEEAPPSQGQGSSSQKEYPSDPSLPDIKNSLYGSDDFRMFSFKVRPCSRAYSHDWTECPFVHPGENARRRDPRRYHYSCVPCPDFRKGSCRRGDACEYAHGVFECWLHPAQYRTRLCKDGVSCLRRVCFFAHTPDELRPVYTATGSAIPSPRAPPSPQNGPHPPPSPMDMRAMGHSPDFPPMSPSSVMMMAQFSPQGPINGGVGGGLPSDNFPQTFPMGGGREMPNLHLPSGLSRLRAAIHARDMEIQSPRKVRTAGVGGVASPPPGLVGDVGDGGILSPQSHSPRLVGSPTGSRSRHHSGELSYGNFMEGSIQSASLAAAISRRSALSRGASWRDRGGDPASPLGGDDGEHLGEEMWGPPRTQSQLTPVPYGGEMEGGISSPTLGTKGGWPGGSGGGRHSGELLTLGSGVDFPRGRGSGRTFYGGVEGFGGE